MKILHILLFCFGIDSFSLALDAPPVINDSIYVVSFLYHDAGAAGEEHIVFKAVAFNVSGQIVFWRNYDNLNNSASLIKLGVKNVSTLSATITSYPNGRLDFIFDTCSVGSALNFVGATGKKMNFSDVPMGVFPDKTNSGYFAFGRVSSISILPSSNDNLDDNWASPDNIKKIINVAK